jgi:hypothetical protein
MATATDIRRNFDDITIGSGGGDPFCPPEDTYEVRLVEILDMDYPRDSQGNIRNGFDGKPPEIQLTLQCELPHWEDKDGNPYPVRAYFTLKMHATKGYPEPHLFKLLKALNGGVPYDLTQWADEDGKVQYVPSDCYNAVEEMIETGKTAFRATVGPNEKGWARIDKGSVLPLRPVKQARATPKPTATRVVAVTTPEPEVEVEDEGDEFA